MVLVVIGEEELMADIFFLLQVELACGREEEENNIKKEEERKEERGWPRERGEEKDKISTWQLSIEPHKHKWTTTILTFLSQNDPFFYLFLSISSFI